MVPPRRGRVRVLQKLAQPSKAMLCIAAFLAITLRLAPLPCTISATFHSVIGSLLAGVWRLRPARKAGG